jgi:hypothetical protein
VELTSKTVSWCLTVRNLGIEEGLKRRVGCLGGLF